MTEIRELQPTSFAEFEAIPKQEGWNYELIDGMVMMSPRPAMKHQRVSSRLLVHLWGSLKGNDCEPVQEVELALEEDRFIPVRMAHELYNACSSDKRLFLVDGAGHGASYANAPKEYESAVMDFINANK